jgi:hypothetical protein
MDRKKPAGQRGPCTAGDPLQLRLGPLVLQEVGGQTRSLKLVAVANAFRAPSSRCSAASTARSTPRLDLRRGDVRPDPRREDVIGVAAGRRVMNESP